MSQVIAVTGATGKLGQLVIEALLTRHNAADIVAIVRRPEAASDLKSRGVQVRYGDYAKPESLGAALEGVERLLLISGSEVGQRAPQHQAVIDAALKANVKHLVYTSLLRCDSSPMLLAAEHKTTEQAIKAAGLPSTILRNGWYIENYTENLQPALAHSALIGAAGQGKVAAATREDFAIAAAVVLTTPGHEGKVYELHGDESFTLNELAAQVSAWADRPVAYVDMPQAQYQGALEGAGVPGPFAAILADSDVALSQGFLDVVGQEKHLSALIGRPTTTIKQALAALPKP